MKDGVGRSEAVLAGDVLFREGSEDDCVYVIERGAFDVVQGTGDDEIVVGSLGSGDVVGEIAAVLGGRRTATVRAASNGAVRRMLADEFRAWIDGDAGRAGAVRADARARMDHTRLANVLARLVGPGHPDVVADINAEIEWLWVKAGDTLFVQGDESDAAYILMSGQMRITSSADAEIAGGGGGTDGVAEVIDSRVGRGEMIGELGIIDEAPRSATATAIRDCSLGRLSKRSFEQLMTKHPALMLQVARSVLRRTNSRRETLLHAGVIALGMLSPHATPELAATIADEVGRFGTAQLLNARLVDRFLNRDGAANAEAGSAVGERLADLLHEVDVSHRRTILQSDPTATIWTRRVLRSADRVVLVVSARPDVDERRRLADFKAALAHVGDVDVWLAQLNPSSTAGGSRSAELMALSGASRVIQVTVGDDRTVRRLARLISGDGLGLALGGGGARALAHVGVLQSLAELGVEIDAIAGTSMGSIIGGFMALEDDWKRFHKLTQGEFPPDVKMFDKTLPFASLFSGRSVAERLEVRFGSDTQIEDLAIPFVCLSTNLTTAGLVTHRTGHAITAVRASMALPVVFPPVVVDGELLVDGGVLQNLPIGPLVDDPAVSSIIAVDVAPPGGPPAGESYGLSLSGLAVARAKLARDRSAQHPGLAQVVMHSMLVGSARARREAINGDAIDLYLNLNLKGIKLLDLSTLEEATTRGYNEAHPQITAWLADNQLRGADR